MIAGIKLVGISKILSRIKGAGDAGTEVSALDRRGTHQAVKPNNAAGKNEIDLSRPYIRNSTREEVEAVAPKTADGKFIDPNTRLPIEGKYDLGHKAGNEFWREKAKAQAEGLTQKQFNDRMNNPKLYQIEDPASNRSHLYEMPK